MASQGLWLLLTLLSLVARGHGGSKLLAPPREFLGNEFFTNGDHDIGIYHDKVTWHDAVSLCRARNQSLVQYDEAGTAEFVAQALAESEVDFGALWIGGYFHDDKWAWIQSTDDIKHVDDGTNYPMIDAPYWVDKPVSDKGHCMGTDRRLHHNPLTVSIDCDQKRPYICREIKDGEPSPTHEIKLGLVGVKEYTIYNEKATWEEAKSTCLLNGMNLATLSTDEEREVINNRLRRLRPIVESAWIGGYYEKGKWQWASNSGPIEVTAAAGEQIVPGWNKPADDIIKEGCLLIDRHLCTNLTFMEARCDRERPFICELEHIQTHTEKLERVNSSNAWISTLVLSWDKALEVCDKCLSGTLLQVKVEPSGLKDELLRLYEAMAITLKEEIRHVWIGGYLISDEEDKGYQWVDKDKVAIVDSTPLKDVEKIYIGGEAGELNYCPFDGETDNFLNNFRCLNLDRESQKSFFMYGLHCDIKQYFICESKETELNPSCSVNKPGKTGALE